MYNSGRSRVQGFLFPVITWPKVTRARNSGRSMDKGPVNFVPNHAVLVKEKCVCIGLTLLDELLYLLK